MKASKQRGVFRPAKARKLRSAFWLMFVGAAATSFAGACGDSTSEKKEAAQLAEGCVLNSDCKDPYSCTFQRCHEQCATTRDCPDGQRCILTDEDFHVCQLEEETQCETNSDCQGDQQCGSDAECRDECDAASDCVDDQVCASDGSCAEDDEVDEDGNLPDVLGSGGTGGTGGTGGSTSTDSGGSAGETSTESTTTGGTGGGTSTTGTTDPECGNEVLDDGEECDDGGTQPGDGCNADCEEETGWICDGGEPTVCDNIDECSDGTAACHADAVCHDTPGSYDCECEEGFVGDGFDCEDACEADPESCSLPVTQVVAGDTHTCVLFESGDVRCWGSGGAPLGYGNSESIGDNELPTEDVNVGGKVTYLAAGGQHTCAILEGGAVRCWGANSYGELGLGNTDPVGDNEVAAFADEVVVGGNVAQIATGPMHTCAVLTTGAVRCWGYGGYGALGYGNTGNVGDTGNPEDAGNIDLGGTATQVAVGYYHTCALMNEGTVRCWGYGPYGELGLGSTTQVGHTEALHPSDVDEVDVGGEVVQIAVGDYHSCALLSTGTVRCWGQGTYGALGYGDTNNVGDGETPAFVGDVPIGAQVTSISAGANHTCAVLESGEAICWGHTSYYGILGQANTEMIGDDETPEDIDPIVLGDTAESVTLGDNHACALTTSANVRCWGYGYYLGYGEYLENIGDTENPSVVGPVKLL